MVLGIRPVAERQHRERGRHGYREPRDRVAIREDDPHRLKELVEGESRDFGWGYLSGGEGSAAEAAWARFMDVVRRVLAG